MKVGKLSTMAVGALALLISACSPAAIEADASPPTSSSPPAPAPIQGPGAEDQTPPDKLPARLIDGDLALPPAKDLDELAAAAAEQPSQPISVSIDRLGIDETAVVAVGVLPNGDMEVPQPLDVGWYRFGPEPGQPGSAVLAGHVASDGINGAFRHLDRLGVGDVIGIEFTDGSTISFEVTDSIQVNKTALPFDEIFARSGPSQLALITCGGSFDYNARSYEDNIVVVATMLGATSGSPAA